MSLMYPMGIKGCSHCDNRVGCTKKHEWMVPCPKFHREPRTSWRHEKFSLHAPLPSSRHYEDYDAPSIDSILPTMPQPRRGWRPGQEHILAAIHHKYGEAQSIRESVERQIEREKQKKE